MANSFRVFAAFILGLLCAPVSGADKVLVVGAATFPSSLETGPNFYSSLSLTTQTNDPLVLRTNAGTTAPGLAERWEQINDETWRFHLRKNAKFHDGTPFTAQDVKFTIERVLDPKTAYGFAVRIAKVKGVSIVDSYTVDLHTRGPYPTLPIGLTEIVMEPKHYYERVGVDAVKQHPIGTGPFKFAKWVPGDRYELTANKEYWGGAPKVDRVLVRQIPSAATRVASLLSGETHIIEEVPVDLVGDIEKSPVARLDEIPTTAGLIFIWNIRKPPFDNPKVREALDYAIDKNAIVKEILRGRGEVLQGQVLTSKAFGFNPAIKARPYDPAKARAMLKEAGVRDGTPLTLTTRSGNYLSDVDIANVVAGMLSKVGFNATIDVAEGGVFIKKWNAWDIGSALMIGYFSLGDADFAAGWFTKGAGRTLWVNDEYEKLYVEARSTTDRAKRLKAYHRMMEIMHKENPALFMVGLPAIYGVSKKVTGFGAASDKVFRLSTADIK